MGLMDILNGMQNGPRGARPDAPAPSSSSGGMSPMMMALLGLLAYKAIKGGGLENMLRGGSSAQPPAAQPPAPSQASTGGGGAPGLVLPSTALSLPVKYAAVLRAQDPAVVGRIHAGRLLLDLRSVPPELDHALYDAIARVARRA